MDIKIVKLSTGDELVSKVWVRGSKSVTLTKPFVMINSVNQEGKVQKQFFPYVAHIQEESVTVDMNHVIYMGNPVEGIVNIYKRLIGIGIVVPESKPIIAPIPPENH